MLLYYVIDDLSNFEPILYSGYGGVARAYIKKRGEKKTPSIENLDYVHGTQEILLSGKPCVVRNKIVVYILDETTTISQLRNETGVLHNNLQDKTDEDYQVFRMQKLEDNKKPFAQMQEGRLVVIRKTANGNSVVILR